MDRILIADNSSVNLELLSSCFYDIGYEVLTAETGRQVLDKTQLFLPDLIVLDTEFPDMSGFDVCKRLKNDPETKYILILFFSNLETRETRMRAMESGADDILEKTFDVNVLTARVASLLRIVHLSVQLRTQYKENQEKTRIMDYQMKMARQVQQAIVCDTDATYSGIRFIAKYKPAMDIGGDFYGIFPLNERLTGVYVGDVSGHGISASLLVSMLSMMTKSISLAYKNPDQLLYQINRQFCGIFENSGLEIYACMFCLVIDHEKKKLYYSNAGAVLPLYVDIGGDTVDELSSNGMPIGLMKDSAYEFKIHNYKPGDLLFFYTDGLSDIFYKDSPDDFLIRIRELLLEFKNSEMLYDLLDEVENVFYDLNASEGKKLELDDVSMILCRL